MSDFIFQVSDFKFQISYVRFRIPDVRFLISDLRFQISDHRFQIWDFRFLGEPGSWGWGNPRAAAGGIMPRRHPYQAFKLLYKNPLEIPKGIPS